MTPRRWLVLVAVTGCVASGQADPEPSAPPPGPAPVPTAEPDADAPDEHDAVAVAVAKVDLPPAPVDSAIVRRGRFAEAGIQPGLAAFVDALAGDGTIWAGVLPGNGDRDVVIYLPPKLDDAAEVELVYHFHGTYSEHIEAKRPGLDKKKWVGWDRLQQTIDAIDELQTHPDRNVALVYPLSAGKRPEPGFTGWFNKAYDRMWMAPAREPGYRDSFETLHADVVAVLTSRLGVHPSRIGAEVIAEGHSAGGIALRNVAVHGGANVREYIFQDAGFQSWADGCWAAVHAAGGDALVTLVITDGGIADPLKGRSPWCTELEHDATTWPARAAACRADAKDHSRRDLTCEEHEARVEEWADYATWCENMKNDMAEVPGVYVHRTTIFHGDQPRHFTGGLELPPERFPEARPDGSKR